VGSSWERKVKKVNGGTVQKNPLRVQVSLNHHRPRERGWSISKRPNTLTKKSHGKEETGQVVKRYAGKIISYSRDQSQGNAIRDGENESETTATFKLQKATINQGAKRSQSGIQDD